MAEGNIITDQKTQIMKKILVFGAIIFASYASAQVSNVIRHPDSYKDFPFEGVRIVQVEEVASPGNEENDFIFSKVEKGAQSDVMHLQRFTKMDGSWKLNSKKTIKHDGIISAWGSRKSFADYDKDKSVDVILVYSLNDHDFNQESVHLIFSKGNQFYEISTGKDSSYSEDVYSENFKDLTENIQNEVKEFWHNLDKE